MSKQYIKVMVGNTIIDCRHGNVQICSRYELLVLKLHDKEY